MHFPDIIKAPWPWYVAGPLIGLMVPMLLILGNKTFGISSSLRHICAACFPSNISFFRYNWKKEIWNLLFVAGVMAGSFLAVSFLSNATPVIVNSRLVNQLHEYGINNYSSQTPVDLFNWHVLLSVKGFIIMILGGFMVGFGTRYAGGCTSGHSIMGLSNLQLPSLVATSCFMAGGFIVSNLIMPLLLRL